MAMAQMAAQDVVQSVVPTVNVVGEASIEATPTLVNISVSIEGEGKDAKLLRQENGEKLAKVIQAINKEEVPNKIGQLGKIRNLNGRSLRSRC